MFNTVSDKPWLKYAMLGLALIIGFRLAWPVKSSTITVEGVGRVSATPQEVSLIVTRVDVGANVAGLVDQGETAIKRLEDVARRVGGADVEIKKSFYQVTPQTGSNYALANAISIKSRNVLGASELVKQLYAAGATTVSDVSFKAMDEDKVEQSARNKAMEDARAKAKDMAKAAGKRLGTIRSVTEDNSGASSSVSQTDGTNLISIAKRVSVVFEIK